MNWQPLSRIVLVRHGETVGQSSVRFHGASDVELSDEGRLHARQARSEIKGEGFDLVVASTLRRAWQTAAIVAPGRLVRLEHDFREIDFGRWEGLTRQEIAESDPILYQDWQAKAPGFEYPQGEARASFRERIVRGLERVCASGAESQIVVAHKGVVRTIAELLSGQMMPPEQPPLGGVVQVIRRSDGCFHLGRRSS